jgi:hypothetical protein
VADAGSFAGAATTGAMPCISEPEDGAMFPNNWLRPRVSFSNTGQLARLTFHSDKEANDLVAYTKQSQWTMPKTIWASLASHATDVADVTVTVRVASQQSAIKLRIAPVPARGAMVFWSADPTQTGKPSQECGQASGASSGAGGASAKGCENDAYLAGFAIGDETTAPVLKVSQVKQKSRDDGGNQAAAVQCIGCHGGMPDDGYVTFIDRYNWRAILGAVKNEGAIMQGAQFPTLTPGGRGALMLPGWGPFTYPDVNAGGAAYWASGMRIGVASLGTPDPSKQASSNDPDRNAAPHLAWVNLEATGPTVDSYESWGKVKDPDTMGWDFPSYSATDSRVSNGNGVGLLKLTGDPNGGAVFPNWSHDGTTILYASTHAALSGRLSINDGSGVGTALGQQAHGAPGSTDLYTVPFNEGQGGAAKPVAGAATKQYEEYLGVYSPDDQVIAYTRVPAGETMYANPHAEVALIPAGGGTAVLSGINKPPACTGRTSPGVNNVWPRWSPAYGPTGGLTYYFLIFSSSRAGQTATSKYMNTPVPIVQLYISTVTVDEQRNITVYPAVYLWNQDPARLNLTPAWSTFQLPPIG